MSSKNYQKILVFTVYAAFARDEYVCSIYNSPGLLDVLKNFSQRKQEAVKSAELLAFLGMIFRGTKPAMWY